MPFLVGPVVALLGVFSVFVVLRTRARARQSLYATRRADLEHRAMDRRRRALAAAAERDTSGPLGQSWDASPLSPEPQRAVAAASAATFEITQRVEPAPQPLVADLPGARTPESEAPPQDSRATLPPLEKPGPEPGGEVEPPSQPGEEAPNDAQETLWATSPFAVRPPAPTPTPAPPTTPPAPIPSPPNAMPPEASSGESVPPPAPPAPHPNLPQPASPLLLPAPGNGPSATIPAATPALPETTPTGESAPPVPPRVPQPDVAPPLSPPLLPAPTSSPGVFIPAASEPTPIETTLVPPSLPPAPDQSVVAEPPTEDEPGPEPLTDPPTPPLAVPAGSWAVVDRATGLQTVMLPGESYLPEVGSPLSVPASAERADEELKEGLVQSVAGYAGLVLALVATMLGIVLMFANGHG